jgi:hypothetical protein
VRAVLIVAGVVSFLSNIVFCIIAWVIAFILVFVEIPFCIRVQAVSFLLYEFP